MKKGHLLILLITAIILFFGACHDESDETDYNPNVNSSRDFIYAEDIYFEIINIFFKGITDPDVLNSYTGWVDSCTIEYHTTEDMMHFHYGDVNRWCGDKYRRGSIYVYFEGPFFTEGSTVSILTDSLFVDDDLVEGSITAAFLGEHGNGYQEFTVMVDSGLITLDDSINLSQIHYFSNYTLTWQNGILTPGNHDDDVLLVTGTAGGRSVEMTDFQVTVQDPLVDELDCHWIVSGIHEITVPSAQINTGTIDYNATDMCNYQVDFYFGESQFYDNLKH